MQAEGFPWDDLGKIFYRKVTDGQGTKWRRNIAKNFNRLGFTNVTDRRQTTDRRTDDR